MAIPYEDHGFGVKLLDLDGYQEDPKLITPQTSFMIPFGSNIWKVDDMDSRMVVIALEGGGGAWIWNPTPYRQDVAEEIEARCGGVRHIVAPKPNPHLSSWRGAYPAAKLYVECHMIVEETVDFLITDTPMREYGMAIDQLLIRGSSKDEIVFFHKCSSTVIFCDLIHRHVADTYSIVGYLKHQFGYANSQTPKDFQLSVWWSGNIEMASRAVQTILNQWKPTRLIVASGECASEGATEIVKGALRWIPEWKENDYANRKVTLETSLSRLSFTTGTRQASDHEQGSIPCVRADNEQDSIPPVCDGEN